MAFVVLIAQVQSITYIIPVLQSSHTRRKGFTLVEIMIVVAIIATLAAIAVPNFLRARKRSQATQVLEDLRLIDSAIDQYAIETNKSGGAGVNFTDIKAYLKTGSKLYNSNGKDLLGNSFNGGTYKVDEIPKVAAGTYTELSDVAPFSFWSPYK
jgi:prepilin-type N-terminal cleavage/methylation domain-containing protein